MALKTSGLGLVLPGLGLDTVGLVNITVYHLYFPRAKGLDKVTPIIRQLCVPRVLSEKLLSSYHDDQCHIGQERLYETLKLKYWFPLMLYQCVSLCKILCNLSEDKDVNAQKTRRRPDSIHCYSTVKNL